MGEPRAARRTRWLGGILGGVYLALGVAELVAHAGDAAALAFWMPTLFGGGALVLTGVYVVRSPASVSRLLVLVGLVAASVATAWTIVLPLLAVVLVVLVLRQDAVAPAAP